ncbi:hypothetical protein Tco_0264772, partial [Tanacetum coccineum]
YFCHAYVDKKCLCVILGGIRIDDDVYKYLPRWNSHMLMWNEMLLMWEFFNNDVASMWTIMAEPLSPDHVFDFLEDDPALNEEEFEEEPEEEPEEELEEEPEGGSVVSRVFM